MAWVVFATYLNVGPQMYSLLLAVLGADVVQGPYAGCRTTDTRRLQSQRPIRCFIQDRYQFVEVRTRAGVTRE